MNTFLAISVALQFMAFIWAIRLARRERDWRFILLTVALGILAARRLMIFLIGSPLLVPWPTPLSDVSGLILGIVTLAAIVAFDRVLGNHRRSAEQLQLSHQRLHELAARLHTVREEERSSLSHEMLDGLGQVMVGLKIEITMFTKQIQNSHPQLLPRSVEMLEQLDSSMHTIRNIANTLRPSLLDTLGLVAAIEWQAETFQDRTDIQCSVCAEVTNSRFENDMATAVFRILQESLSNVFHHSRASEVNVMIKQDKGLLSMHVQDNGIGISEADFHKPNSLGIIGMRERALPFAGSVHISRALEGGTIVTVNMPLNSSPIRPKPCCKLGMH